MQNDLTQWWMDQAQDEANKTVSKAVQYGSNSMIDVGHQMARQAGRTVSHEEAAELACYFYIVGKMGRWADAIIAGERVSDDTLFDVGVYVRMAQRIRTNGGWPGEAKVPVTIDIKVDDQVVATTDDCFPSCVMKGLHVTCQDVDGVTLS